METIKAEDKLAKAKTQLFLNHPFFAVIGLSLDYVEVDGWCNTMATDGKRIYWNRKFLDSITTKQLIGVILHECLHVAWLHMTRRGTRDPLVWNIATDIIINHTVLDMKLELPPEGIVGKQYDKYRGMSAYQIYDDLMKNAVQISVSFPGKGKPQDGQGQDQSQGQGQGDGQEGKQEMWGGVIDARHADGTPLTESELSEMEHEVKIKVSEAARQAKARGKLPAGLEGLIEAVGKPKINWKDYIQNWVSGHTPDNYTWSRPNRKMYANHRIYMPRMQLNGAGIGVLSIDTSGSVSDEELRYYVREVVGVIELCSPDKLYIIQHDAIVQKVEEWNAGEDFSSLKTKGRGGTCIMPVFDHVETLDDQIDWMICFTDMGIGDYPRIGPDYPVLWCATGPDNAPFGTYIPLRDAMEG